MKIKFFASAAEVSDQHNTPFWVHFLHLITVRSWSERRNILLILINIHKKKN